MQIVPRIKDLFRVQLHFRIDGREFLSKYSIPCNSHYNVSFTSAVITLIRLLVSQKVFTNPHLPNNIFTPSKFCRYSVILLSWLSIPNYSIIGNINNKPRREYTSAKRYHRFGLHKVLFRQFSYMHPIQFPIKHLNPRAPRQWWL